MEDEQAGVDLSGLHRELDSLKARLCRCGHQGNCLSCRGFEIVRQQAQAVAAAASQPVLMQVAQEAAMRDLFAQLGGLQEKLTDDPQLSELMTRFAERIQEDLGGPEELEKLLRSFGLMAPGAPSRPGPVPEGGRVPYDDLPTPPSGQGSSGDNPTHPEQPEKPPDQDRKESPPDWWNRPAAPDEPPDQKPAG